MIDDIKEVYLSNLEWTKTHNNMGGVICNLIFKDNMSYDDYQKLFKTTYFVLCNKDYITNLQEENDILKRDIEAMKHNYNLLVRCIENGLTYQDYKSRNEKAIEYIKEHIPMMITSKRHQELLNILGGADDE